MAAKPAKTTARMQKAVDPLDALDAALETYQVSQHPQTKSSSETKTFAPHQTSAVNKFLPHPTATKLDENGDVVPMSIGEYIEQQAQIKFSTNAAIEAAVDLAFGGVSQMPTSEEIKAKQRIAMTQELWDEAMARVTHGMSMAKVCRLTHMPSIMSFHRWMDAKPEASKQYQTAVFTRTDNQVEQITELSAEMKRKSAMGASREEIDALKVLINSIQWTASRINPGKYGDKLQMDVKDERLSETQVTDRLLVLQKRAQERATKHDDEADANS